MLNCPVCGTMNGENAAHCVECNYPLQGSAEEYETPVSRCSSKRVLTIGIIVALVCTIVVLGARLLPKKNPVSDALRVSGGEFVGCLVESGNLSEAMTNAQTISKVGAFVLELKMTDPEKDMELQLDYSRKAKLMSGTVQYGNKVKNFDVDIEFFADNKRMLFLAPDLVEDAYGFKLDDFTTKYEKSYLRKIIGMPSAEKFELGLYKEVKLREILKAQAGEPWDTFVESVSIKKFEKREMHLGQTEKTVTVYKVTWSASAADKLAKALTDQTILAMPINLISLLPNVEPDCRVFIDEDGRMVGGDFVLYGSKYTLRLEGEENVWSDMSMDVLSLVGDARHLTGGVVATAEGVHLTLEDENGKFLSMDYDNASGVCSVQSPFGTELHGSLLPKNGGYELTLGGNVSMIGSTSVWMTVSPAASDPKTTDRGYVNLFDMKAGEWTRLLVELKASLGIDLG